jgi:glycosyltransferase involved in cell wall biosynthesis
MRIGIDCRTILNPGSGERAGVGHYTYFLVKNLISINQEDQIILFFNSLIPKEAAENFVGSHSNVEIKFFPFHKYRHYLPIVYSHILVSSFLAEQKLDLYHNPANIIPLRYKGKSIITIHDLAIYKNAGWFPSKLSSRLFSTKLLIPSSIEKAAKIIAVSENTKNDLREIFKIPENKIEVIYEGVELVSEDKIKDSNYLKNKFKISGNYILYLGTIEPRKNIAGLLRAYKELRIRNPELNNLQLVIAGSKGWKYGKVFELIEDVNKQFGKEVIKYMGYVSAEDKLALMTNALCFVYPTFYEGFGLPVLEAMAQGTPVISSDISSIPEIVGNAGILINPYKISELSEALKKILTDKSLGEKLSVAGRERAKEFNWKKCAEETLEVYKSI